MEGGVAGFDVAAEAALLVRIVEVALEVLALGGVGVGGEFRVQAPCLVEAHHLQPHRGDGEVDLDGLRGDERDTLADVEALFQQVVVRHDLVDEADAEGFLRVDVVAG